MSYGTYNGLPTYYDIETAKAWVFVDGKWKAASAPDIFTKARTLTPEKFTETFGQLPAPPKS